MPLIITPQTPRQGQLEPISWVDLSTIISTSALHLLGRSNTAQTVYLSHSEDILAIWASPADFLLHTKFGLKIDAPPSRAQDPSLDPSRITTKQTVTTPLSFHTLKLLPNDFPYHFENGVRHYCLWKIGGEEGITAEEIEDAEAELRDIVLNEEQSPNIDVVETCNFLNPDALKSISAIEHVHILAKPYFAKPKGSS